MRAYSSIATSFLVLVSIVAPAALFAQAGETEKGEVAVFTGTTFGIGSHPVVGGSIGSVFSRYGMGLIETTFVPLGSQTLRVIPGTPAVQSSRLYDFNVSVHIRIPVGNHWGPYAILGGGLLWDMYSRPLTGPSGTAVMTHFNDFYGGFHTGAGVRYYIRENWGIRPEFKVVLNKQTYTRLSVGIFYVLPSNWP